MSTYIRYFIHYLLVTTIISIVIGIIVKSGNLWINKYILLTYIAGVIFFCAGMSLFISSYSAENITIYREFTNEQEMKEFYNKLDQFIIAKTNREIKSEISKDYYLYKAKNSYLGWLMNTIEVHINKNVIKIIVPKEYIKNISKL